MAGRQTSLPSIFLRTGLRDSRSLTDLRVKQGNYATAFMNSPRGTDSSEFSFFDRSANPWDKWGKAQFLDYGLVDGEGDVVVPNPQALRVAGKETNMVFAVDFAARAFEDFRYNFTSEGSPHTRKIMKSPYAAFNTFRGYVSLNTEHSKFLEDVYSGYMAPYLRSGGRDERINNFHDFVEFVLNDFYPNVMIPEGLMMTRSNFARSAKCTPLINGLIIEIDTGNHNDDLVKYNRYLASEAYDVIKDGAAVHGFMMDKNAPWRFVANLNSPKMLEYIQGKKLLKDQNEATRFKADGKEALEKGDVFDYYYNKVYLSDIPKLKATLRNIYNAHVGRRIYTTSAVPVFCSSNSDDVGGNPVVNSRRNFRSQISKEELMSQYEDDYWLFQYMKMRLLEVGVVLNPERLLKQKTKIFNINKYISYDDALLYVNSYVKGFGVSLTSGDFRSIRTYDFNIARKPGFVAKAQQIDEG